MVKQWKDCWIGVVVVILVGFVVDYDVVVYGWQVG